VVKVYGERAEVKVRGLDYTFRAVLKWSNLRHLPTDAAGFPLQVMPTSEMSWCRLCCYFMNKRISIFSLRESFKSTNLFCYGSVAKFTLTETILSATVADLGPEPGFQCFFDPWIRDLD
jgi:hypothetical protein